MSTSTNSHSTICLPAHILDAHITPRAREVLMLLASQTSAESPALWICQASIAARLRCSPATVARAIQKLIEAKLIAETGRLREGRYKFYHVRWGRDENIKAASKKITKPVRKVAPPYAELREARPIEGVQLILPTYAELRQARPPVEAIDDEITPSSSNFSPNSPDSRSPAQGVPTPFACPSGYSKGGESTPPQAILKDSRIAYYAEIARKRHQESQRLHQSMLHSPCLPKSA